MHARNSATTSLSFYGFIKDHVDALLLITGARLGMVPRFRRRLNASEQDALIFSGSIFLWTEEESCMKRWTDGYPWSPSRIFQEFLLYREMVERGCARSRTTSRLAVNDSGDENLKPCDERRRKTVRAFAGSLFNTQELESLVRLSTSGPPTPEDVFKRGGLMKKTYSLSLPGETWHLVSYYTLEDVLASRLLTPRQSSSLAGLEISEHVRSFHALSARRHCLGTSILDHFPSPPRITPPRRSSTQTSVIQSQNLPQVPTTLSPNGGSLPPGSSAEHSRPTLTMDDWLHILNSPVGNMTQYLHPSPQTYTTPPHSVDDRRQTEIDDSTAGWYAFS